MSDNTPQESTPTASAAEPDSDVAETTPQTAEAVEEDESTIGTGTSMALGCIAGTALLIAFGLLFLFISTLI